MTPIILFAEDVSLSEMTFLQKLISTNFAPAWTPRLRTDTSSRAALADLAWFDANPDRKYHVRQAMEGDEDHEMLESVVIRKDEAGLRLVPVPADFLVPDKECFAETLYVMSLEIIATMAKAYTAGQTEMKLIDQDELAAGVAILRVVRRMA